MAGIACPNCGLLIRDGYQNGSVLYCCRGCAEGTFCRCRVTASSSSERSDPVRAGAGLNR